MNYSVVIPAFNEEHYIGATLQALRRAMTPLPYSGEIIVTDNRSTDRTPEIAREFGAKVVYESINQISRARNAGAAQAGGQLLVFVDADTLVPPTLLRTVIDRLTIGTVGGGGAAILPDRALPRLPAAGLHVWNRLSTALGIAAGSFIYCRMDGFRSIGGFDDRLYVAEEFFFSLRYRRWCRQKGLSFEVIRDQPVISSARKIDWYSPAQFFLMGAAMVAFPIVMRFKRLCRFWYRRPPAGV
jgi:glycosyltransferase involved in cell wall biosynthesis